MIVYVVIGVQGPTRMDKNGHVSIQGAALWRFGGTDQNSMVPTNLGKIWKNYILLILFFFVLRFGRIWGVLNGPPPIPIPGVNVKVPFWGKQNMEKMFFIDFLYDLYVKIEKMKKMY